MKKSLGAKTYLYPMPVLMVGTYNDDGTPDLMTMAWGGVCDYDKVELNLDEAHRTADNIKKRGAFTLAICDGAHIAEADYVGSVSAKQDPQKVERSGLRFTKSDHVDAPVFEDFPLTLECTADALEHTIAGFQVIGKVVNTLADERILGENGEILAEKMDAVIFETASRSYWRTGEKIGNAWEMGKKFMK